MSETLTNYIEMPLEQLNVRGRELADSFNTIDHCPERKAQIQREMSLIAFETWFGYQVEEFQFDEVSV